jgi:subtilisin family serine protease
MGIISCRTLFAACAGFALSALSVATAAENAAGTQYGKFYFKKWEPLSLDASQIAVQASDLAKLRAAAGNIGIAPASIHEWAVAGWWLIDAPAGAAIEGLVAQFAAMPEVDFASPVFRSLPMGAEQKTHPIFPTRDLMVGFNEGTAAAKRDAALGTVNAITRGGGTLLDRDWGGMDGVDHVTAATRNGFEVLAQANALAQRGDVRFAEPDMMITGLNELIPNDSLFSSQWGLNQANDKDMNVPEAWDITTGSSSIVVMVIDIGVQLNHPDLNTVAGFDFTGQGSGGNPFNSCDKHGTACAGCISARINNSIGVAGVAADCRVASARVGISTIPCDGTWSGAISNTINALNTAATNGYRVTSNSNAYGSTSGALDTAYTNTHNANNIVHFASAGNGNVASLAYPASSPSVNAVMAIDSNGNKASFSQWGVGTKFAAPGVGIATTDRTGADGYISGDYVSVDGTSFSCPNTAAVAALVLSRNAALSAAQVESIMYSTAKDLGSAGYDTLFGYGIPDAWRAVRAALTRPPNDDCGSAIDVSATGTFTGNLAGATFYTGDGLSTCGVPSNGTDVWYHFTAVSAGTLRVTTCGTNDRGGVDLGIDTVLNILSTCGGTVLACNDDWTSSTAQGCSGLDAGIVRDSAVAVSVAAGQNVRIRVSRFGGAAAGTFTLNVYFTPANDACVNAIDISSVGTSGTGNFAGMLAGATNDGTASCGTASTNGDIWWKFTAPATCGQGRLRVTTCGTNDFGGQDRGVDTVLSLHHACGAASFTCNDDWILTSVQGCPGSDAGLLRDSAVETLLAPGETVLIRASNFGTTVAGQVFLNAFYTPANDACASAIAVTPGTYDFCTSLATTDGPTETSCYPYSITADKDVWFSYRATCDGTLPVSLQGSGFDTELVAYAGGCPAAPGFAIACNDDYFSVQSYISFSVTTGNVYLIRVGGYFGNSGAVHMTIGDPCPIGCIGDFNQDGGVDGSDVNAFFAAWEAGDASADVNQDGGVDGGDVNEFFAHWEAGC